MQQIRSPHRSNALNRWSPLESSRENRGATICIARNQDGKVLAWNCRHYSNICDPLVVETFARRDAIQLARNNQFQKVSIEGDALSVIQSFSGKDAPISIQDLIHDFQLIFASFQEIICSHVLRDANVTAHDLAVKILHDFFFFIVIKLNMFDLLYPFKGFYEQYL